MNQLTNELMNKIPTFAAQFSMKFIYQTWWKVLAVLVILYTLIAGFLLGVPHLHNIHETIRNTYFMCLCG